MQRFRISILAFAALFALAAAAQGQSAAGPQTFRVSTVADFLAHIGSNRTILLEKGDYLLSSGYGYKSAFVAWSDYDDGKELGIHEAFNLTIRGMDGARLVSDSATAYMLGVYGGSNVKLDNLAFARLPKEGTKVSGGTVYAEDIDGFSMDRCELSGPTTNGIELSGAKNVDIAKSSVKEANFSALSATSSDGIEVSDCTIADNDGNPLFYLEDSDHVAFANDTIRGNEGGNLIEIYATSGSVNSIVFSACRFEENQVDDFSGTSIMPEAKNCSYIDNSFGEDWASASVASTFGPELPNLGWDATIESV
ncbi:MAG: right-handed parallel beta-helix repeat-containing protein [Rectinemataceae bacterium]